MGFWAPFQTESEFESPGCLVPQCQSKHWPPGSSGAAQSVSGNRWDRDGWHERLKNDTESIKTHQEQPLQLFSHHPSILLIRQHVQEGVTSQQSVSISSWRNHDVSSRATQCLQSPRSSPAIPPADAAWLLSLLPLRPAASKPGGSSRQHFLKSMSHTKDFSKACFVARPSAWQRMNSCRLHSNFCPADGGENALRMDLN